MIRLTTEKLSLHVIWIFGLLELITVPLVAWLPEATFLGVKSPLEGAVVGFAGIFLLFFILNRILPILHWKFNGQPVTGISVFSSALWNALLLALLFAIQEVMGLIQIGPLILHQAVAGFISTFGAVCITIVAYQVISKKLAIVRIIIRTRISGFMIKKFSLWTLSILAGTYEAIALPIILIWQKADSHPAVIALLTGLAGGLAGSCIVVLFYNTIRTPRIFFIAERLSPE